MTRAANLIVLAVLLSARTLVAQSDTFGAPSFWPASLQLATIEAHAEPLPLHSVPDNHITVGSWVRPAKWISLGTAAGLAVLGFVFNEQADDRFERLQLLCSQDPPNCRDRNPDSSYRDPLLESLYQQVLDRDQHARLSLIAANLSFAGSVALFIIDFQRDEGPGNIPYEPPPPDRAAGDHRRGLELSLSPGALTLKYFLH